MVKPALTVNAATGQLDVATTQWQQARDGFHGGGFASAVRTDERHQLTLAHLQAHPFDVTQIERGGGEFAVEGNRPFEIFEGFEQLAHVETRRLLCGASAGKGDVDVGKRNVLDAAARARHHRRTKPLVGGSMPPGAQRDPAVTHDRLDVLETNVPYMPYRRAPRLVVLAEGEA